MQLANGRLAEPQEIADAVALLASPRSGSTTGTEFVVDSGWLKAARQHRTGPRSAAIRLDPPTRA
jgi:NAD(P)-dependent dehydrogenase (short-subunit alcohol dehydrogenase family)